MQNTKRYQLILQYDGTEFSGWQIQPNAPSVQETLNLTLSKMFNQPVMIVGAGRTDAGVHATGQVAHFDVVTELDPTQKVHSLNKMLPESIRITHCFLVDQGFHARFSAIRRRYIYSIYNEPIIPPFLRWYHSHVTFPIRALEFEEVLSTLLGTHDFSSFCAHGGAESTTIRTIFSIEVQSKPPFLYITITADAFLRKMIRLMMGVSLGILRKSEPVGKMQGILDQRHNQYPYSIAPPNGLYLHYVEYPAPYLSIENPFILL